MKLSLKPLVAGAILFAAAHAVATPLYEYSVNYGGYALTGSFNAVANGSQLTSITNMTLLINGEAAPDYNFDYTNGWSTHLAYVSLTPGVSDFTFGTYGRYQIGVSSSSYGWGAAYINGTWAYGGLDFTAELSANQPAPAPQPGTVPEPASILLTGIGLAGLALSRRRPSSERRAG